MIVKLKAQIRMALLALSVLGVIALGLQGCALPGASPAGTMVTTSTPRDIPTWTPRVGETLALPTETRPATISLTASPTPTVTSPSLPIPTPKTVTITMIGGNLNVRRGPSIDYDFVGVLYDGEVAKAVGRDRISRWVLVEIPSKPGVRGWATTETDYTSIQGDVSILPFVQVEPAIPAYIRNCTKHTLRVLPTGVELLSKFDEPYNEERFGVGLYQVYDLEDPHLELLQEVSLSEGKTVDIRFDWTGDKSKCE